MKIKRPTTVHSAELDTSSLQIRFQKEPVSIMSGSQSSVEVRYGPRSIEFTVKSYSDSVEEAAERALKTYRKVGLELNLLKRKVKSD